jgi:hypothetical protein
MSQVDTTGVAADLLARSVAGLDVHAASPVIQRAAAWSMLDEPADYAPYGWTHCLTMSQAVLGIADALRDPRLATAVAATFVVGFRAGMAQRPLAGTPAPDPGVGLTAAIEAGTEVAPGAVWHAADADLGAIVTELVSRASTHGDAHYAKYTLACLDAAGADPQHTRLYLAAAAKLAAYWHTADA